MTCSSNPLSGVALDRSLAGTDPANKQHDEGPRIASRVAPGLGSSMHVYGRSQLAPDASCVLPRLSSSSVSILAPPAGSDVAGADMLHKASALSDLRCRWICNGYIHGPAARPACTLQQ